MKIFGLIAFVTILWRANFTVLQRTIVTVLWRRNVRVIRRSAALWRGVLGMHFGSLCRQSLLGVTIDRLSTFLWGGVLGWHFASLCRRSFLGATIGRHSALVGILLPFAGDIFLALGGVPPAFAGTVFPVSSFDLTMVS